MPKKSKGHQVRTSRTQRPRIKTFEAPKEGRAEETLWVRRTIDVDSMAGLLAVANAINPHQAAPKKSNYSLTLLHPNEIKKALPHAQNRGHNLHSVAAGLRRILPPVLSISTETDAVTGLRQESSTIAVGVSYPSFAEERFEIISGVREMLGLEEYDENEETGFLWPEAKPHITIAQGKLSNLSNRDQIDGLLPVQVGLRPGGIGPIIEE